MSVIRNDIEALIDQYPGARFAVIAFASRPSLDWPLSEDAWSLRPEVARLTPYPASADDRRRERGGRRQRAALSAHRSRPAVPRLARAWCSTSVLARPVPARRRASSIRPPVRWTAARCSDTAPPETRQGLRRVAEQLGLPYVDRDDGRSVAESAPGRGEAAPSAGAVVPVWPTARSCTGSSRCWPRYCCCSSCSRASATSAARGWPDGMWRCDQVATTVAVDPAKAASCCSPHRWR